MRNKWLTYAALGFICYALVKQNIGDNRSNDFVANQKSSVASSQKNNIPPQTKTNTVPSSNDKDSFSHSKIPGSGKAVNIESASPNPGFIEKKIISFITNLVDTEKGRELIDKILTSIPTTAELDLETLTKDPYHSNATKDIKIGTGPKVECGQTVKLNYSTSTSLGASIYNSKIEGKPVTITIGSSEVLKGLEYNLINMQKTGLRRAVLQPSISYGDPKFYRKDVDKSEFINLEIELIDILSSTPKNSEKIEIFEKKIGTRVNPYKCGDNLAIYYKIKDISNNLIYSMDYTGPPISITIGNLDTPYAISRMAENIGTDASRMAIVPVETLLNIHSKPTNFFKDAKNLPTKGVVLLQIDSLPSSIQDGKIQNN